MSDRSSGHPPGRSSGYASGHPLAQGAMDTRWQRWMPESLDAPAHEPEPEPEEDPIPDAAQIRAEIERLKKTAQQVGHAEGYQAGHAAGMAQGIQEGHEQGHQQGYDAGFAAGHAAGMKQADQELAQLHAVAQSAAESLGRMEADMGQALIHLSIHIAEQVLHSTLTLQPQVVTEVVRNILRIDNQGSSRLTLRVHPDDYTLVHTYLETDPAATHWRLLADETLRRGDCVADTPLGTIDATLETRWKRVTAALGYPLPLGPTPEPQERVLPLPAANPQKVRTRRKTTAKTDATDATDTSASAAANAADTLSAATSAAPAQTATVTTTPLAKPATHEAAAHSAASDTP